MIIIIDGHGRVGGSIEAKKHLSLEEDDKEKKEREEVESETEGMMRAEAAPPKTAIVVGE